MPKHAHVALAMICLLAMSSAALARGRGTWGYLVTADGQLAASLGETRSDLLDPTGFVLYRYREGRITAAPLDKPETVLWSTAATPQIVGLAPLWRLLPEVLITFGEETITGIDRASGKVLYKTDADGFTRETGPLFFARALEDTPPTSSTLLLIDNTAQEKQRLQGKKFPNVPARLARFDLVTGKFDWKTNIVTAAGEMIVPGEIDPRGIVGGLVPEGNADFIFDPVTGKALAQAPAKAPPPKVDTTPRPRRLQIHGARLEYLDAAGKAVWSREEPGLKGDPILTADSVVLPIATERSNALLVSLALKDGAERWRLQMPNGPFADSVTVEVQPAKNGYLVQVHWLVLD